MTWEGGSSNCELFKIDTSSVASIDNLNKIDEIINVYPNPNNGQFTLQINNGQLIRDNEKSSIEVYNELGEKVYSQLTINNSQLTIDLRNSPNGVYLIPGNRQ